MPLHVFRFNEYDLIRWLGLRAFSRRHFLRTKDSFEIIGSKEPGYGLSNRARFVYFPVVLSLA